jgi:hypothetical protein
MQSPVNKQKSDNTEMKYKQFTILLNNCEGDTISFKIVCGFILSANLLKGKYTDKIKSHAILQIILSKYMYIDIR